MREDSADIDNTWNDIITIKQSVDDWWLIETLTTLRAARGFADETGAGVSFYGGQSCLRWD